jgi:glycosyltransferase involved in cell wall biosynthesis
MLNPTSDVPRLLQIMDATSWIREHYPELPVLCLDCDTTGGWLYWHPKILKLTAQLFRLSSAVLCRDERLAGFAETLVEVKAYWLPEVASFETAGNVVPKPLDNRNIILSPRTLCGTFNSRRFALLNYAVMKALKSDPKNGRYRCHVIGNPIQCTADGYLLAGKDGDVFSEEEAVIAINVDVDFIRFPPDFREAIIYELGKARVFINLDQEFSMGHWQYDAATCGTPTVCTDSTVAGRLLWSPNVPHFDLRAAVEEANRLLHDDDYWMERSEAARKAVKEYTADKIRVRFEEILEDVRS